jgi:hypothetical protein
MAYSFINYMCITPFSYFLGVQRVDGEQERMGREENWVKLPSASSILSDSRPNLMHIELTFLFSHFLLCI